MALQPGEEKARGISSMCTNLISAERVLRRQRWALLYGAHCQDYKQLAQTETQDVHSEQQETLFFTVRVTEHRLARESVKSAISVSDL